jgi:hypothetical protein
MKYKFSAESIDMPDSNEIAHFSNKLYQVEDLPFAIYGLLLRRVANFIRHMARHKTLLNLYAEMFLAGLLIP